MELKQKTNWGKKVLVFVSICIVVSFLLRAGSNFYFENYWYPGLEKRLIDKCVIETKAFEGNDITEEKIIGYCNCNLQKIKAKYKPKELNTISPIELNNIANECSGLIK